MVSQAIEAPATDQEPKTVETEIVEQELAPDDKAAPESTAAAAPQVVIEEDKPEYMTKADWERKEAEVAARAAADALESDRRRRQTENARKASQEKKAAEDRAELIDTVKAAFGAEGIYQVPEEAVIKAIDRAVRKGAEQSTSSSFETVDAAWDYLTAPAYNKQVELDPAFELAATRLGPKVQHLIDTIRPVIEKEARRGYVPESSLAKWYETETARRNAKGREGQTELKHVEGAPSTVDRSIVEVNKRISKGTFDEEDQKIAQANIHRIRSR